ncbi:MAG TPA: hypothetical protein VKA73_04670 [Rubrobacter sp.]|nr:hypothetical protein [Rubrobacter sp.]
MTASGVIRGGGLAALVGGALWVVVFAVYAWRPQLPGPGPPFGSFDGLRVLGLLSLLLIALGFLGLDLPSWRGRGHGRLGRVGFDVAMLGVFAIVVSGASWPVGMIGAWILMVGSLLVGAAALSSGTLPRWGALALVVGSAVFFFFDTDPARAWFALPYGGAWVAVGYLLWARGVSATKQPVRVR